MYRNGQVVSEVVGISSGYAEEFGDNFHEIEVYSATVQTVQIVIRFGVKVYYDTPPTGNVNVTALVPTRAAGANTNPAVTNANTQLLAANPSRSYLLIQNKDTIGNIYINFGAAATVANGVLIGAGGSYELDCNILTSAINAIGDIANNTNIVVVEG